ncbi:unnamed protein product [Closterium sp. Naga37s-1]|nr:unnamed protein product [Closterium sp. Naga37s-1]
MSRLQSVFTPSLLQPPPRPLVSSLLNSWAVEEEEMWEKAESWGFQTPGEYNRDVLRAALAQPSASLRFTWGRSTKRARASQEQPPTWQLAWAVQRSDLEMRASVQLRAVEGEEQQRAAVGRILDEAMRGAAVAQTEQQRSREACGRMQREAERCLQQSERFREEKSRLEDELLGKFLLVLNAKKARIRELEASLQVVGGAGAGGGGGKGGGGGAKAGSGGAGRVGKGR